VWNAHNTVFGSKRSAICATVELSYNIGERKTWTQANFAPAKIPLGVRALENVYIVYQPRRQPNIVKKVLLTSFERRRCSNEAKTQNPLKFAGVPQTRKPILAASGPKFTILWGRVEEIFCSVLFLSRPQSETMDVLSPFISILRRYCCLTGFFLLSIHALVAKT